jgi:SNF2 family DNA or RNA helicase
MSYPFYPHQPAGVRFLADRQHALLGDDPGLGKTLESIAAADAIGARNILVSCPAVARLNWMREFIRWQVIDRPVFVANTLSEAERIAGHDGVVIVSYEGLVHAAPFLRQRERDLLICDEAHLLKSPGSARTQAVYGAECRRGGDSIAAMCRRIWLLTGTPVLNGVHELWPHYRALWPYAVGDTVLSYDGWLARFCAYTEGPHGAVKVFATKEADFLREAFEPFILRRRLHDVMPDMPELRQSEVVVPLSNTNRSTLDGYAAQVPGLEAKVRAAAEADYIPFNEEGAHIAAVRRMLGAAKLIGAAELIATDLDGGLEKAIVFAHHLDVTSGLRQRLARYGAVLVRSDTPHGERQAAVDRFQQDPKCRLFVANTTTAGTAITLTAAHDVFIIEPDWVPAINRQAIGRALRIGQRNSVHARFVVADHPLDDALTGTLARKTKLVEQFEGRPTAHQKESAS